MSKLTKKECEDLLVLLKSRSLLKVRPLFSSMVVSIKWSFVDDDELTACTNGISICIGIKFWSELASNKERLFLMLHEICHIILMHVERFQSLSIKNKNANLYNMAADYFINLMLITEDTNSMLTMPNGGLYDESFSGLSTEEIYKKLPNNWGDNKNYNPDLKPDKETSSKAKTEEVKSIIKGAMGKDSSRNYGSSSTILMNDLAIVFKESKVNWKSALKKYATQLCPKGRSYARPSRRTMFNKRLYIKTPKQDVKIEDMLVYIDVSYSCTEKDVLNMLSELNYIFKNFKPNEILFSSFNTDIRETFSIKSLVDFPATMKISGGTDVQCCIDHINAHTRPVSVAIILSDFYTDKFNKPDKVPLLMLCINHENFTSNNGKVIHYNP